MEHSKETDGQSGCFVVCFSGSLLPYLKLNLLTQYIYLSMLVHNVCRQQLETKSFGQK